jgi:hypothetical protein
MSNLRIRLSRYKLKRWGDESSQHESSAVLPLQLSSVSHATLVEQYTIQIMSTLQAQLGRLIKRKGEQDPLVQMLRIQIEAQKSGKTSEELYMNGEDERPSSNANQPNISVLPFEGARLGGVLVQGELLKSYERVLRGLKTKRKTKNFYKCLGDLFNAIDESLLNDVGDPIGNGMPIHYLQMHINHQGMADMLGLEEAQLQKFTKSAKANFARSRITSLESDYDADICPGYWLLPVTSNSESRFFLGYSVTGYSFSGIEWRQEGAFLSKADFIKKVCCESEMLFENCLCIKGGPSSIEKIDDPTLLRLVWGD